MRGARVHNLKNISVDIPLNQLVAICGVSGSGKSSLALGVLYAEGSRRYMDALATYTRRRITQAGRADVDEVLHVPAALALRQRPGVPGVRSTFGTSTELLNHLRLLFSRLGSHACPNGHPCPPSMDVALERETVCLTCGARFYGPGAEAMAFNSEGACPTCEGTGIMRAVDESTLVPDETLTIDEGAVVVWGHLMWSLMKDICREMGVRTDVPFCELTAEERDIVFHGPAEKKHILYYNEKTGTAGEMDFTYFNAIYTVENALSKVKDEKGMKRVARYLTEAPCSACGGTRLSDAVRATTVCGIDLAQATSLTLDELAAWLPSVPPSLPNEMQDMARTIIDDMAEPVARLQELGLGYLALDRASSTLSNGERQRAQLARAVRNRTHGVLYVLDEPSIGLHPANVDGLLGVMDSLLADGNSVVVVDHEVRVLAASDHLVEIGPASGANGGQVIAQGSLTDLEKSGASRIAGFIDGSQHVKRRVRPEADRVFDQGAIRLVTDAIHTVRPLDVRIPRGRLTCITGVSGSGKTTLVLESLLPALEAQLQGAKLPEHVHSIEADGILRTNLIDATPIGINVRSTVATYSNVMDELRRAFAKVGIAKERKLGAGAFSYNTGKLRCPTCDGTGQITLDVQFLPDVDIPCPDCRGSRFAPEAYDVRLGVSGSFAASCLESGDLDALSGTPSVDLLDVPFGVVVEMGQPGAPTDPDEGDVPFPLRPQMGQQTGHQARRRATNHAQEDSELAYTIDALSLPEIMALTVDEALAALADYPKIASKLQILSGLGLGYLTLGESTPALSGGEAQRLKLASEIGRAQEDALFVFDEPTIGLHPLDVEVLLDVLQSLLDRGATVVVIEHDLDMIANADWIVDLGPGGGEAGGRVVAAGAPEQVVANKDSVTGRYLKERLT